ncbi:MAG: hypothetical protein M3R25_12375 [Bacteroidota bacterium]|nr:hypothetical protein [Bacteroidota bacterium]
MKYFISLAFFIAFFLASQNIQAGVYSRINSKALVSGTSDCYNVNYSLWESQGTTSPADDVLKGSYNAVIGTDCPMQITPVDPFDVKPAFGQIDQENDIEKIVVYPNPTSNDVKITFPKVDLNETKWSWSLISFDNVKYLSGEHKGSGEFNIHTNTLKPGRYILVLVNDKNEVKYTDITVIH